MAAAADGSLRSVPLTQPVRFNGQERTPTAIPITMHQEQFVYSANVEIQQYVGPYRLEKTLGKGQTGNGGYNRSPAPLLHTHTRYVVNPNRLCAPPLTATRVLNCFPILC